MIKIIWLCAITMAQDQGSQWLPASDGYMGGDVSATGYQWLPGSSDGFTTSAVDVSAAGSAMLQPAFGVPASGDVYGAVQYGADVTTSAGFPISSGVAVSATGSAVLPPPAAVPASGAVQFGAVGTYGASAPYAVTQTFSAPYGTPFVSAAPVQVQGAPPAQAAGGAGGAGGAPKSPEDAAKQAQAQRTALQGVRNAFDNNVARDFEVYGANLPPSNLLPSITNFGGTLGKYLKVESRENRAEFRERAGDIAQRQILQYKRAHPNPTQDDIAYVNLLRAGRNAHYYAGEAWQADEARAFLPSVPILSQAAAFQSVATNAAFLSSQADRLYRGLHAERTAYKWNEEIARRTYLKNTSNVDNRRAYRLARDYEDAKKDQEQGAKLSTQVNMLQMFPAQSLGAGLGAVPAATALVVGAALPTIRGTEKEADVTRKTAKIAEDKFRQAPSDLTYLAWQRAEADDDWKYLQAKQAKSNLGINALGLVNPMFGALFQSQQYLYAAQISKLRKKVSRLDYQIAKTGYEKRYGSLDGRSGPQGANPTQQRLLAMSAYGPRNGPPIYGPGRSFVPPFTRA